jgi:hypothetical protein
MDSLRIRVRRTLGIAAAVTSVAALMAASPAGAFVDKDCSDFPTQKKAQKFFKKHNPKKDPHGLDADNDGKACETLP